MTTIKQLRLSIIVILEEGLYSLISVSYLHILQTIDIMALHKYNSFSNNYTQFILYLWISNIILMTSWNEHFCALIVPKPFGSTYDPKGV